MYRSKVPIPRHRFRSIDINISVLKYRYFIDFNIQNRLVCIHYTEYVGIAQSYCIPACGGKAHLKCVGEEQWVNLFRIKLARHRNRMLCVIMLAGHVWRLFKPTKTILLSTVQRIVCRPMQMLLIKEEKTFNMY